MAMQSMQSMQPIPFNFICSETQILTFKHDIPSLITNATKAGIDVQYNQLFLETIALTVAEHKESCYDILLTVLCENCGSCAVAVL
ncbi:hypothetical protein B0I35DRAFT_445053 [Stachybotrys elegans]|uniref:Uncharacterized protein n=1 Tax=Stachybotrys elegans TaxID=80388 RepID=A0A8K0SCV0_9HYPO|nr:hypothetical protein B0I35DRAFT_445053 [Stachybotrys elegans]